MVDFSSNINLIISLSTIIGVGVIGFLIIKTQMVKFLKEELDIYKNRVLRLEEDIKKLQTDLINVKTERDYLKNIIIEALTTRKKITDQILVDAVEKLRKGDK